MSGFLGGKNKKESNDPMVKKIIAMRDSLLKTHEDKEAVGMACKGMYKCSKLADQKCLDGIMKKLETLAAGKSASKKGVAGGKRRRSRSKSKSRSRSRSKSRSKSKSRR